MNLNLKITPFTKNEIKIGHGPKCKIEKYRTTRKKIDENYWDLQLGRVILDLIPKHKL